ncbi:GAF domain-containing protein [Deinobacterium chartae]|uniref:GAF domain-containing protein n=1 Tax=Deinobacterium chartae TaxID=521158 RepID=A0A841I037_9DEIO|nr:GAF domain-containing protein [Deinobacterium chartae]MBB6099007.1 GAF domain-containing protein [Deinobacterium chartae]
MHDLVSVSGLPKPEQYAELVQQLRGLLEGERDSIANLANASALLYHSLEGLNWAGFYLHRGDELVLGPFQGKVACVRLALGRGVCGTAAASRTTQVVEDVHAFPGHIACDPASRSEIVVPLIQGDRLIGVLDIDSPQLSRFDAQDREGLEAFARVLLEATDF